MPRGKSLQSWLALVSSVGLSLPSLGERETDGWRSATLNGRAGVAASLSLARIEGSRSRRRRSVVPLCPFDTAQLPTFYSGQGLGGGREGRASERRAFQSFDGTFRKNDPSLPPPLPPFLPGSPPASPIRPPFLFIQTAIFLQCLSWRRRRAVTVVAEAAALRYFALRRLSFRSGVSESERGFTEVRQV